MTPVGRRAPRIVEGLDQLGRIAIPQGLRDAFRLDRQPQPAFAGDGDLRPADHPDLACVFCGTTRHVIPHRGKGICVDCVRDIRDLVSRG